MGSRSPPSAAPRPTSARPRSACSRWVKARADGPTTSCSTTWSCRPPVSGSSVLALEKFGQVVGLAGLRQAPELPGVLDGAQQGIVVVWGGRAKTGADLVGDHDQRDEAIGRVIFVGLIKRNEENPALLKRRAVEETAEEGFQELIADLLGTVVHVVTGVRHDHLEVGRRRVEVAEIQDVRAPRLGGADVGELDRRLVPARVCSRTVGPADRRLSQVALERDVLGEDAPALVVLAELIDEIAARQIYRGVAMDALG